MEGILSQIKKHSSLTHVYCANILLSIHYFLIIYINSSALEQFFSASIVGLLYIIGSILGLLLFVSAPTLIEKQGAYTYLITVALLECAVVIGMAQATTSHALAWFFVLHAALVPMILYSLDVYLEDATTDEGKTGSIRGVYLTITNVILVISPLVTGFLVEKLSFRDVYFVSALAVLPLIWLIGKYLSRTDPLPPKRTSLLRSIAFSAKNSDIRFAILAQFILQFFYAWMVIYLPLYLIQEIGFDWQSIGKLFTIMLLPFMLFELPIGWFADRKYGEKEFMIFGFIAMALAATSLTFTYTNSFATWAVLLFFSRFGASFVEITTESYFFKKVKADDSDLISMFRMTRPIAYIVAPLIATVSFHFFSFSGIFWVLGGIVLFGSVFAYELTDTR